MRKLRQRFAAGVVVGCLAALGACVVSDFADGQYACDPGGEAACPPGLLCARDGYCRVHDTQADGQPPPLDGLAPSRDASPGEGGVSDAADACSTATWSVLTDGRVPLSASLDPSGKLFVGGQTTAKQGWVAEVDVCDGHVLREKTFDLTAADGGKVAGPNASGLLATGTTLEMGGGAAVPFGLYATAPESTLAVTAFPVVGVQLSAFDQVVKASDNAIWLSGQQEIFASTQKGWVAREQSASGQPCQATFPTNAPIAAGPSGSVYVMAGGGPIPMLMQLDTACQSTPLPMEFALLGTNPSVDFLLSSGMGMLYGVGNTKGSGGNTFVFLLAINLSTGAAPPMQIMLDPNPGEPDDVLGVASDAKSLFVGVNQRAGFGTGTATVYRYDLPLVANAMPAVASTPFGSKQLALRSVAVAPDGQDAVFVVGATLNGAAGIARCRKSGACAP